MYCVGWPFKIVRELAKQNTKNIKSAKHHLKTGRTLILLIELFLAIERQGQKKMSAKADIF